MSEHEHHISARLYQALKLAFQLHGHDSRKQSPVPYLAHLLSVCALVQQDGGTEDEAVAGLLHDALEDKAEQIDRDRIKKVFGEHVAKILEYSIDTPPDYRGGEKPPWLERKQAYLAHVSKADPTLLRVTVADKVDNARAILADFQVQGESIWRRFNASKQDILWYYQACIQAYQQAGFSGHLLEELRRLIVLLGSIVK